MQQEEGERIRRDRAEEEREEENEGEERKKCITMVGFPFSSYVKPKKTISAWSCQIFALGLCSRGRRVEPQSHKVPCRKWEGMVKRFSAGQIFQDLNLKFKFML